MQKSRFFRAYNLEELKLLPTNWAEQIKSVADTYSYRIHLDGKSSTSREPKNTEGVDIFMVEGDIIKEKLPWLYSLYKNQFIDLACMDFKNNYTIANDVKIGVNINYLIGDGARYEWHVDSNPLTGLLFVTSHPKGTGGELVFKDTKSEEIVYPNKGWLLLFDAREIPHTVLPLKTDTFRISIPMNFFLSDKEQTRPSDLDNYIYNNFKKKNNENNIRDETIFQRIRSWFKI